LKSEESSDENYNVVWAGIDDEEWSLNGGRSKGVRRGMPYVL
jgi:hypothetical protein